jgi:hypothetical protein
LLLCPQLRIAESLRCDPGCWQWAESRNISILVGVDFRFSIVDCLSILGPVHTDSLNYIIPSVVVETMTTAKRHNGLASPHSRMQISTWVFLPVLVLQFLLFITPILPLAASIVGTVVFLALCAGAAIFGFMATAIDPMDPRLSDATEEGYKDPFAGPFWQCIVKLPGLQLPQHSPGVAVDNHDHDNNNNNTDHAENEEKTKYCWVCEHDVALQSMHCRYCNKCIANFDHHCQWLNTCVGERNYPFFYKTLWSIAILLVMHALIALALSIDILIGGTSKLRANEWFSANLSELVVSVNLLFVLLDSICLILILQLLVFHIKLRAQNLTTYKFILQDNASKRELKKRKAARKSKRATAMGDAKRSNRPLLRWRLYMGQYLEKIHPCLDPLSHDDEQGELEEPNQEEAANGHETTGNGVANEIEDHKEDEDVETSRS